MHDASATPADAKALRQRFPFLALAAWALVAFAIAPFVQTLDAVKLFGFPLGFFMLAQGCILAFALIALLSALHRSAREGNE